MSELSLIKDGVTRLDYPPTLFAAVQDAVKAWEEFVALPNETKDIFTAGELQAGW